MIKNNSEGYSDYKRLEEKHMDKGEILGFCLLTFMIGLTALIGWCFQQDAIN